MPEESETPWYAEHANLALTAAYMESQGSTIGDIVYMVAKPWKFNEEFSMARHELELELGLPQDLQQL